MVPYIYIYYFIVFRIVWIFLINAPIVRNPCRRHGNPLQYSCLENPQGQRSLPSYSPWGLKESDTTERLSTAQHTVRIKLQSYKHNQALKERGQSRRGGEGMP